MKKIITVIILSIFAMVSVDVLFALDLDNIIAYPVPFNPKYHKLNIANKPGTTLPADINRVDIKIHDINGDLVFSRQYTGIPIIWNGYNNRGKRAKPGLYIIRVQVETLTGEQGIKIIRIVIVH